MNIHNMSRMKHVRRLILHHADYDFLDYPIVTMKDPIHDIQHGIASVVDEIDRWHTRKWKSGLGYHFLVGNGHGIPDGYVAVGRSTMYQGAHVRKHNHDSIGILVVGDLSKHDPTKRQIEGVISICATECFAFGLDPINEYSKLRYGKRQKGMVISGHHDWPPHETNSCPASLEKYINGIRIETEALLFSRMVALPYTP